MIKYTIGDATQPPTRSIIAHICNNRGGWGKGFSGALGRRYPEAENMYRRLYRMRINCRLGDVQFTHVGNITIANMIAQNGYSKPGQPAISYAALETCLALVRSHAEAYSPTLAVHMPRIGVGLAGGKWDVIEPMIVRELCERGVEVTVYDLPKTAREAMQS